MTSTDPCRECGYPPYCQIQLTDGREVNLCELHFHKARARALEASRDTDEIAQKIVRKVYWDARRELFLAKFAVRDGNYSNAGHYLTFVLQDVEKLTDYVRKRSSVRESIRLTTP